VCTVKVTVILTSHKIGVNFMYVFAFLEFLTSSLIWSEEGIETSGCVAVNK